MFKPYFNYTVTADDNMMRIRDNLDPTNITDERIRRLISEGKLADVTNRMTGGIMFEKEISRQRFTADFNWTYTKFDRFSSMDNDVKGTNGKWNWFLGNRLEGNMGATYVQSLMPFIFQPGLKIIRTEQTQFFNGAWHFHPSWRLVGEYTRYSLDTGNSPRADNLNRVENRFEGGIDYLTPSKNTLGVLFRDILGDFTNPVRNADGTLFLDANGSLASNGYDQKEVLAKVNWAVSEKSQFQGTAGWIDRHNNSFQQRDFSGFNGRATYHWQPTAKLGFTINGWRLTSSMNNLTANFSQNTGVSIVPSWNITQKIRLEGDFSYETRNFDRFTIITDPQIARLISRKNTFRNAALKLNYNPYPGLQLSTSIYHSDFSTDAESGGFNANGVTANLQYIYGQR
nr:XrtB/PEP-CTERM-associated polysaccharide biosynthesis outer membrane protein EpsL [Nitrosomonas sp. Nm84]